MAKNKGISRRMLLGLFTTIFSLLVIFVAYPLFIGVIGHSTEIVRVKSTISVGQQITKDNTEIVEVSGYNLPSDVIKKQTDVIGKYATAKLEPGDYILKTKIVDDMITSGNYMSSLTGDKQIISVAIKDFSNGISGKILPGDIVTVYNNADAVNNHSTSYPELQYVKVLAVTNKDGVDMGGEATTENSELPVSVTLLVSKTQAQLLSGLDKNGNIYFTLVYRGDGKTANEFLQKQETILNGGTI